MRTMVWRWIVVFALLLALVPMTALADEASEYPTTSLPPDQARLVQAEHAIDNAATQADMMNATARYYNLMGAAMARADADVMNAQAIAKAHPGDTAAQAQLDSAVANYTQLMKLCQVELTAPTAAPGTVPSEAVEEPYVWQGSLSATWGSLP